MRLLGLRFGRSVGQPAGRLTIEVSCELSVCVSSKSPVGHSVGRSVGRLSGVWVDLSVVRDDCPVMDGFVGRSVNWSVGQSFKLVVVSSVS